MINNKNKKRLDSVILKKIKKGSRVLACGVGDGSEVQYLRSKKINTYGIDPSRINKNQIKKIEKYILRTEMNPKIFGKLKFDFIYAFEVIEHVGCKNYGVHLEKNFYEKRLFFIESIINKLNKKGVCFLTTLNKNFPLDIGHQHHYNFLGKITKLFFKPSFSLCFDKKNFLLNYKDFKNIFEKLKKKEDNFNYKFVDMSLYPSIVRKRSFISNLIKFYLKLINKTKLRTSFLNPLIGIEINKK